MLIDSEDIPVRRRDVVCGGGAAVFSAIVVSLLGGAKPARAQPISGSVPEVDGLAARVVTDSYQFAVAPSRKLDGRFHDRDLYITVLDLDGKVLAHGQREDLMGKILIEAKDPDGKLFIKERVELARQQPSFWQNYKFMNPVTKNVEPKQMYCERLNETTVCGGVYSF